MPGAPRLGPEGLPRVSVVVPARNEASSIRACIASLANQVYPRDRIEILVSDGRSNDGTREIVKQLLDSDERIRLLDNPEQVTPTALNVGVRHATGDVIAVMSAHAVAPPDYVRRGVEDLLATGAWCVGGFILRKGTSPIGEAIAAVTASPIGVGDAFHNYARSARWVETAFPGMWPRSVFETVGLFDRELVRNQDDELSYRIREAGGRIWYDPMIMVEYESRTTLSRLFEQYRQYGYWKVRVLQKHPAALRWRHFVPAAFVGAVVLCLILILMQEVTGLVALLSIAILYFLTLFIGTRGLADDGPPRAMLIAAASVLHVAYGLGFWQGLLLLAPKWFIGRQGRIERLERRAV